MLPRPPAATPLLLLSVSLALLALVRRRCRALHAGPGALQAVKLGALPADVRRAGDFLKNGGLVAFPTETVYGLGASAFDVRALRSVFATKGRPMTDPLIVHVSEPAQAEHLLRLSPRSLEAFAALAAAFWPGPLTLVAAANPAAFADPEAVLVLSAGSGMIGVRIPAHPAARALLAAADVPVAAPSANRFGHVSPTTAAHVLADLGAFPILVVDGGPCRVGIESTVLGLERCDQGAVLLHRRGGVSEQAVRHCLQHAGLGHLQLLAGEKRLTAKAPHEPAVAPGQLLTHYAPDVDTYLAASSSADLAAASPLPAPLSEVVLVDFGGQFAHLRGALARRDLSEAGDAQEACANVFDVLRWTETVPGVRCVVLPNCQASAAVRSNARDAPALADRLFRAASGRYVQL
jgi:L-threonylcarbamoyladenylate synthase